MRSIPELEEIYYLKKLAENYETQNGLAPFELSHWDPSDETIKNLVKHLRLPSSPLAAPYIYSYYLDSQEAVVHRLGFSETDRTCLLVQSGTIAMLFAVWWLKALRVKRLLILGPAYFPVFHSAEIMGLTYSRLYMIRDRANWHLPRKQIAAAFNAAPSQTAIWVTNPIFCTGCYLNKNDIAFLHSLLERGGTIVADECLSTNRHEIDSRLAISDRFLALHSPHKSVCLNAVKFAAIVFDLKFQKFFDDWSDVIAGGLPASSYCAISHFLSDNFSQYQAAFFLHIDKVRQGVLEMIRDYGTSIETDQDSVGHFMTCYARNTPGNRGNDKDFLRRFVSETGALLIPGVRNHFSPNVAFNFRVNLARGCPQFFATLRRSLEFLSA